jgi:copper chaperone
MWFMKGTKRVLEVEGMSCGHCEQAVEAGLKEMPGVARIRADHRTGRVTISYRDPAPDWDAVRRKIVDLGYTVKG